MDLAVWLDPEVDSQARLRRQLDLMGGASQALGGGEVQVVILNDAPPLLAHRALRSGSLLSERDPRSRIALEAKAIERYLDPIPLREELGRGLRRRLEDGSFGRSRGH